MNDEPILESDFQLLCFLHERLQYAHGENTHIEYMHALRRVIANTPANRRSPPFSSNDLGDLMTKLAARYSALEDGKNYPIVTPTGIREMTGQQARAWARATEPDRRSV